MGCRIKRKSDEVHNRKVPSSPHIDLYPVRLRNSTKNRIFAIKYNTN